VLALEKKFSPASTSANPCFLQHAHFRGDGRDAGLARRGIPIKYGAQFELGNGSVCTRFIFREGRFNSAPAPFRSNAPCWSYLSRTPALPAPTSAKAGRPAGSKPTRTASQVEARDPEGKIHQFRAAI